MKSMLNRTGSKGRWTNEEHFQFLQGLRLYGRNWKKIEQIVETRNGAQIRSHAQKFFNKQKERQCDLPVNPSEQIDSVTSQSKAIRPAPTQDGLSFYMGMIVELSSGRIKLDFWNDLVDIRDPPETSQQRRRKSSFIMYEEQSEQSGAEAK